MKVFVTGGTGTVGNILVQNLLDSNHDVTILTRNISRVDRPWKDKVNLIEGNVLETGVWTNEMIKHDAVIHLVGENIFSKRWTEKQKKFIYDSRVISSQNIADAVSNAKNPPRTLISVSGADYYPASEDKVYTEEDEPGEQFLSVVSHDWEQPFKYIQKENVRVVIFRMGVAFGYDGSGAERMFIPHKLFVGGWIGSGHQIYSWIHIKDFAGLLQWALENEDIMGVYNGATPDYKTMKELANIGGEILHRWTWTWLPGFMLKIVLGERADVLLKGRALSAEKVINAGYEFQFPTAEEALSDILPELSVF